MYVETVSASFSHPLHQMLFPLSIFFFFLLCHDLVGFWPFCVNKTYPLAFIACDSQIPSLVDLSFYKDVRFSYSLFTFFDWGWVYSLLFFSFPLCSIFTLFSFAGRFIAGKRIFFLSG